MKILRYLTKRRLNFIDAVGMMLVVQFVIEEHFWLACGLLFAIGMLSVYLEEKTRAN